MEKKRILISAIIVFYLLMIGLSWGSDFKDIKKRYQIQTGKNLIIYLDLDACKISLSKHNNPGEISISGQINEKYDELFIDYDKRHNEFSLTLERRKWFKSIKNDNASRLEILLPDDVIIELTGKIKAGEINFDLGGLKLKDFELRNFAGEVEVDFSQPNKIKMDLLDINVKIGATTLRRLGNARFSEANINGGIGELYIDLLGEGLKSSSVDIDLDIGSTTIYLPRNFGIKLKSNTLGFLTQTNMDSEFDKKGRYYYSKNYNSASKTMYVTIHSGIGELRVNLR